MSYIYLWNNTILATRTVKEIMRITNVLARNIDPGLKKILFEFNELRTLNADFKQAQRSIGKRGGHREST